MPRSAPQNGRPFDPERREAFLARLREGTAVGSACRLVGVSRQTVRLWVKGTRPEHRAFAKAYHEAIAELASKAYKQLQDHADAEKGGSGSVKATLAILGAHDPRFSDADLRKLKLRAEIAAGKVKQEQERQQREIDLRIATARCVVLEKAAAIASGQGETPGFGLAALLGDEDMALEVRTAVAAWAVRNGYVAVERMDWNADEPPAGAAPTPTPSEAA